MKGRIIGIVVLVLIVAAALVWQFGFRAKGGKGSLGTALTGRTETVKGYIGSEKTGFLEDDEVKAILRSRFGLVVDYAKAGSVEMVRGPVGSDIDFLWPSSEVALAMYRAARDNASVKSVTVFSSPIVLYSWDIVCDALVKAGLVTQQGTTWFVTDFPKLITLIGEKKAWADVGVPDLYGKVMIISTDPNKSNSGMVFAGLLASVMNGDLVTEDTVAPYLPKVRSFFSRMGYMESSTGFLFEQYLRTGVGSYPLIVGYENQIVEFSLQNKELWSTVKNRMRILYPVPTVWSSHPLIAVTPKASRLMDALVDPQVQKLAWERHGFRTGLAGAQNDPSTLPIQGIAGDVTKVLPMPTPRVMDLILDATQGGSK